MTTQAVNQLPVAIALDRMNLDAARQFVGQVGDRVYAFKIHHLWDANGPSVVATLKQAGAARIWVDLKLADTSDTVVDRAKIVAQSGADILTVHAFGGVDMMMDAMGAGVPCVFAITMLTSLSEEETHLLSGQPTKAAVLYRAQMAKLAGMSGAVCSPHETAVLAKRRELNGLTIVNPGIRLAGQDAGQQKRFDTPEFAISQGADLLVVGSSVTKAKDPLAALDIVEQQIAAGRAAKAA